MALADQRMPDPALDPAVFDELLFLSEQIRKLDERLSVLVQAIFASSAGNVGIGTTSFPLGAGYINVVASGSTGAIFQAQNTLGNAGGLSVDAVGTRMGNRTGALPTYITSGSNNVGITLTADGTTIMRVNTGTPTLGNTEMAFERLSNTQVRLHMRGTDGVLRGNTLTLT